MSGSQDPGFNTRAIPLVCYFSRIPAKGRPVNEEGVERELTTILAADVVGYLRLMGSDEKPSPPIRPAAMHWPSNRSKTRRKTSLS